MATTKTVEREQTWDLEMGTAAHRLEEKTTTVVKGNAAGPGTDAGAGAGAASTQPPYICCIYFLFVLALVSLGVSIVVGTPAAKKICLPIFCSSLILLVCTFGCAVALTEKANDDEADETEGSSGSPVEQESHAKVPVVLSFQPSMTVANF